MKNRKMIVSCFLFAVTLVAAAPVDAEDFIITVPVRLYKMVQGVGAAKVTCEVLDSQGQRISMKSNWSTNNVNHYPAGLEEDIVLKMDAYPGKDPRTATDYKCDLKIQLAWVTGEPWQTPSQDSNSMYLKPKPGTEFRVEDSGPLHKTSYAPKIKRTPLKRLRK
ncbi:hypothetical protein ACFLZ5_09975 [Thermodesulfobacteriota bacterium]